jgi:hypothetical protein
MFEYSSNPACFVAWPASKRKLGLSPHNRFHQTAVGLDTSIATHFPGFWKGYQVFILA